MQVYLHAEQSMKCGHKRNILRFGLTIVATQLQQCFFYSIVVELQNI